MAKDAVVELRVVVHIDRRLVDDVEALALDCLESDGLMTVSIVERIEDEMGPEPPSDRIGKPAIPPPPLRSSKWWKW